MEHQNYAKQGTFTIVSDPKYSFFFQTRIHEETNPAHYAFSDEDIPSIHPLYLQRNTYKDLSLELVPSNLTIRYFRFLELFLTYMRI
jgi:hypothetical protein